MKATRKSWGMAIALSLCAALLLSGCGGKSGSDKSGADRSGGDVSAASSAAKSGEPVDYSKFNAYMDLYNELDKMEDILVVYFMNVEYAEEFAVAEGGDYGAIKEAVQFYTAHNYWAQEALKYVDEEPAYPKVDAAVRALGDSPEKMMNVLENLAIYMNFDDYKNDNLARAAEIHADLWDALQVYDPYYGQMMDAMDELADESRNDDMEGLLNDGQLILYHSRLMIHNSEDILEDIWGQLETSLENADPEAEFVLPEIDMTGITPLFDQFNTAYEELTAAMAKEEEQEKIFSGPTAEYAMEMYTTKANNLYARMGELVSALNEGADYSEAYDGASEALDGMISGYNGII